MISLPDTEPRAPVELFGSILSPRESQEVDVGPSPVPSRLKYLNIFRHTVYNTGLIFMRTDICGPQSWILMMWVIPWHFLFTTSMLVFWFILRNILISIGWTDNELFFRHLCSPQAVIDLKSISMRFAIAPPQRQSLNPLHRNREVLGKMTHGWIDHTFSI